MLILKGEDLAHLHLLSTRAIGGWVTDFEGDIDEEAVFLVVGMVPVNAKLLAIGEGEDIAMAIFDA